jgi:hypothetical protein
LFSKRPRGDDPRKFPVPRLRLFDSLGELNRVLDYYGVVGVPILSSIFRAAILASPSDRPSFRDRYFVRDNKPSPRVARRPHPIRRLRQSTA